MTHLRNEPMERRSRSVARPAVRLLTKRRTAGLPRRARLGSGVAPKPTRGAVPAADSSAALKALGRGGPDDRVTFQLVRRLLARCLELLRPLRGHLLLFFTGFSALALAFVPIGVLLYDAFWTRALQGNALHPLEASALGLDPAVFAGSGPLAPDARRAVLERCVTIGLWFG